MSKKGKRYLISFIEEGTLNSKYDGYIGGSVEITGEGKWPESELRFFTNKVESFHAYRNKWDMKYVCLKRLCKISEYVAEHFMEGADGKYLEG